MRAPLAQRLAATLGKHTGPANCYSIEQVRETPSLARLNRTVLVQLHKNSSTVLAVGFLTWRDLPRVIWARVRAAFM